MEGKFAHEYNRFERKDEKLSISRTIYWGEVISIDDPTSGGAIRVRINGLDNKTSNIDLPKCYPFIPKFIHQFPKIGEAVRILIEDPKFPQRSRFWVGSIISQPQKIEYDNSITALSTTNVGLSKPEKSPNSYPDAKGIYPELNDIAIIGRLNNDIILRDNEIILRVGKHVANDKLSLNKKNLGSVRMVYESTNNGEYRSSTIIQSDKIALLSHDGSPKFKSYNLSKKDRDKIFINASPIPRGSSLIAALEIIRKALVNHIHPYSKLSADQNDVIVELQKIDFNRILNKNIVTN